MACIELFHYLNNIYLTYDQWLEVYKRFSLELEKVHSKSEWTKATLRCTPSSIYRLPTNEEYVNCLGISLGSELCCFLLTLNGRPTDAQIFQETFDIPRNLQLEAEDEFFEFIISCLSKFTKHNNVQKLFLPLGVTYKMPNFTEKELKKTSLRLDKAIRQSGLERDDVELLLTVALTKNLDLETCKFVIVNQSSALLMLSIGLIDSKCRLVVTEYGAAYVAAVENLELLTNEQKRKGTHTIMELDWSEFADGNLLDDILNQFDKQISKTHVFEKMIASKYRCEMFQKILLRLVKDNIVFPFHADQKDLINLLNKEGCFQVDELELVEEDSCPEFETTRALVKKVFHIDNATIDDCFKLQYICQSLAKRAAQMVAVILSSWINRHNESNIVVGLDERLYRLKERYTIINDIMYMLVRPLLHYQIVHISEDVGIAAAITAGMSVNHSPIPY